MTHTDLDLMDWKEIENTAIQQIKNGHKILITAGKILEHAEDMIRSLGSETEGERLDRVAKEPKNINTT